MGITIQDSGLKSKWHNSGLGSPNWNNISHTPVLREIKERTRDSYASRTGHVTEINKPTNRH
jgi:hypothetical protein